MSVATKLEELRDANKSLLNRLKENQTKLKKISAAEVISTSMDPPSVETTNKAWKVVNGVRSYCMQENKINNEDPTTIKCQAKTARKAMSSSRKDTQRLPRDSQALTLLPLSKDFTKKCLNNQKLDNKCVKIDSQSRHKSLPTAPNQANSTNKVSTFSAQQYAGQLMDEGNIRIGTPKSILMTPKSKDSKREPGHVTFQANDRETLTENWSPHPFLGYDWIAGLLEVKSPIANKSEQFFANINEFRRVNKEECVHENCKDLEVLDMSSSEDEQDYDINTHQCVYCYRVNGRLFTSPLGTEAACPICKRRRSKHSPALEEPAYIRVSIPRSSLLPPYKYKAHRRKSFDPTDTLSLPSHCLAGWENIAPSSELCVYSLDLKTSAEPNITASIPTNTKNTLDNISYYASRARSASLLNMSHSIYFQNCRDNS
ncbi:hypothetical protein GDO86_012925 [Hymenochirus boettgeri]|uniref:Migration and invasion-inhibitory protein n=1 Tax=Hymenochirus boettgeri TaxID=247094 RepID=A0A8T2IUR0_9PIPI|nr:hypothetical protein GDO86_012925 [Hymenochirus boettgeri]KAG8434761.1 hypothetical protein GDO86_012925 [Hymenochirus boettgeri]